MSNCILNEHFKCTICCMCEDDNQIEYMIEKYFEEIEAQADNI